MGVATPQRLQGWVASWEDDAMFAGTSQAVGAEDVWYLYGVQLENAKSRGDHTTGGSTDIFKYFDQLQREFMLELCRLGGFPPGPLLAYSSFHAQCCYYNTIAAGLGAAHFHPCGIPQGCPLNMMLVSHLVHPWACGVRALGAVPRCLADDLLVSATGRGYAAKFGSAYAFTFSLLHALGAKAAHLTCH